MREFDCDILVVGLGPVGDSLAALCALHGLSVTAIDREPDIYPLPRAAVFDDEIMRIFQMIGIAESVEPLCRVPDRYQFLTADGEVLLDFHEEGESKFGWSSAYALHQPGVERALRNRLADLDVDLRLSTEFVRLTQFENGVEAVIRANGAEQAVFSKYVVGCGGAWGPVREAIGTELFDYGFDEPWLVLDTIIREPHHLPAVAQQICDPKRPVTHLKMSGDRFRWEFMMKPGETEEQMLTDEFIRTLLSPWDIWEHLEIERRAVYRFHGLVAEKWRDKRVLIAGDSAHQMPPFAGQGMCSGIRDAANLAWKLAEVIQQEADETLLDSYQEERDPHVRAIIETAIAMGKVVCILDEEEAAQRNEGMLARKRAGEQDIADDYPPLLNGLLLETELSGQLYFQPVIDGHRFDSCIGMDAVLIGHHLPRVTDDGLRTIDLGLGEGAEFHSALENWLIEHNVQAVLVRPDRHIFGTGDPENLYRQWHCMLGRSRHAAPVRKQ